MLKIFSLSLFLLSSWCVAAPTETVANPIIQKKNSTFKKIKTPPPGMFLNEKTGVLTPDRLKNTGKEVFNKSNSMPAGFELDKNTGMLVPKEFKDKQGSTTFKKVDKVPKEFAWAEEEIKKAQMTKSTFNKVSSPPKEMTQIRKESK